MNIGPVNLFRMRQALDNVQAVSRHVKSRQLTHNEKKFMKDLEDTCSRLEILVMEAAADSAREVS